MDLFDILGPVMIGPSSSHTAGAARIGRVARRLLGEMPKKARIGLYGSFAKTWQGHGIDRAILGGLLDMGVDDERLRSSRELAAAAGMEFEFTAIDLKNAHPNTVVLDLTGVSGAHVTVQAASVGGGNIRVQSLNGLEVGFAGDCTTIVIQHSDAPGVIADVSRLVAAAGLNIATMRVFRSEAGGPAAMALELDEEPPEGLIDGLRSLNKIQQVTLLNKL